MKHTASHQGSKCEDTSQPTPTFRTNPISFQAHEFSAAEVSRVHAGMCRTTDGSKYVGGWQGGKRHGQGRCMYASADQYEGQWEEDVRHGQGGCIYASGDKYKGMHAISLLYSCIGSVCQCCAQSNGVLFECVN